MEGEREGKNEKKRGLAGVKKFYNWAAFDPSLVFLGPVKTVC